MIVQFVQHLPALIRLYRSKNSGEAAEVAENATQLIIEIWKQTSIDDDTSAKILGLIRKEWHAEYQNAQKCLTDARIAKSKSVRERLIHDARLIFGEIAEKHDDLVIRLRAMLSIVFCYILLKEQSLAIKWLKDAETFSSQALIQLRSNLSKIPKSSDDAFFETNEDERLPFWKEVLLYDLGGWIFMLGKSFVNGQRDEKRNLVLKKIEEVESVQKEIKNIEL
ncbi:MAG: hypothetical protein Fur0016_33430 [Anaerolineales bacterium]